MFSIVTDSLTAYLDACGRQYKDLAAREQRVFHGVEQTIVQRLQLTPDGMGWSEGLQQWNRAVHDLERPADPLEHCAAELAKKISLALVAETARQWDQAILRLTEVLRLCEALAMERPPPKGLPWAGHLALILNGWFMNMAALGREGNPDYQTPLAQSLSGVVPEFGGEHPTLRWFRAKEWHVMDATDRLMAALLPPGARPSHAGACFGFVRDLLTTHAICAYPPAAGAAAWRLDSDGALLAGYFHEWRYVVARTRDNLGVLREDSGEHGAPAETPEDLLAAAEAYGAQVRELFDVVLPLDTEEERAGALREALAALRGPLDRLRLPAAPESG